MKGRPSTFVASFIGSPPMNLLAVTMGKNGLSFADGTSVDAAPGMKNAATFGFRPEDANVAFDSEVPAGALTLAAEVEAVEPVGAESFLYCAAAGSRIVVRVSGRALAKPGDRLRVIARTEKLHWFDAEGKRL